MLEKRLALFSVGEFQLVRLCFQIGTEQMAQGSTGHCKTLRLSRGSEAIGASPLTVVE